MTQCLCVHNNIVFASTCTGVFHRQSCLHAPCVYGPCLYLCVLYIRRPEPGEGIDLLLSVLAEFSGDFSGLGQLLCQVGTDVAWQHLVSGRRGCGGG